MHMSILKRVILLVAAAATCTATAVTAQPAMAISGCDGAPSSDPFAISGPSVRSTTYHQPTAIQGTGAGELQQVGVWYHKAFTSGYVQRDTVTSACDGTWGTSYVADDDYRVYARNASSQTSAVLIQIAPTITGPTSQVVPKGSSYTIRGTGTPAQTLSIHFHKAGTAPTDYSIVRSVTIGNDGNWTRPYLASVDYRFYATLSNGQRSPSILVQAR